MSASSHEYCIHFIGNVSLAKQTECLSQFYFRQIIVFVLNHKCLPCIAVHKHSCQPVSITLYRNSFGNQQFFFCAKEPHPSSFLSPSAVTQIQREPLSGGVKYTRDGEKLRVSTEISVYLGNGTSTR